MRFIIILAAIVAVSLAQSQLTCGFSCSRNTVVRALIDGSIGTASCSENTNPSRCQGCCESRALQEGLTTDSAAGFMSNDGRACVCCINNRQCNTTFGKKK